MFNQKPDWTLLIALIIHAILSFFFMDIFQAIVTGFYWYFLILFLVVMLKQTIALKQKGKKVRSAAEKEVEETNQQNHGKN